MSDKQIPQPTNPDIRLERIDNKLSLVEGGRQTPICVDFLGPAAAGRRTGIQRRNHPLARAVGRRHPLPDILDGTAGLGRDAFVLACLGYRVTAAERSPVLHALLEDGLARMLADPRGSALVEDRLQVVHADCRELLEHPPPPAVVYLDPMFPERRKSARVKKEMQMFQRLLGPEDNGPALLAAARLAATDRVVVKRPVWADPLEESPNYTVEGSKVRWDVYLASGHG